MMYKKSIFPYLLFWLLLSGTFIDAHAQIQTGYYSSGFFIEMRWDPTKKEYQKIQTIELLSTFKFERDGIAFKKGNNAKWLYNTWEYKGELAQKRTVASDWYLDDRGQKIVIDYDNKALYYYHEYDKTAKVYRRLTLYKNLRLMEAAEESDDDDDEEPQKFRVDMEYVSIYDMKNKKWSDWKEGLNSFIINYNTNGDILHIKGSGKTALYRKVSKGVERKKTEEGKNYQIIEVIDEDGDRCSFQVFDDYSIGIKLIYSHVMIQFSK